MVKGVNHRSGPEFESDQMLYSLFIPEIGALELGICCSWRVHPHSDLTLPRIFGSPPCDLARCMTWRSLARPPNCHLPRISDAASCSIMMFPHEKAASFYKSDSKKNIASPMSQQTEEIAFC